MADHVTAADAASPPIAAPPPAPSDELDAPKAAAVKPDLPVVADTEAHHIVVVGGGAAGLELVTRLGDTLGKQGKARVTMVDKTRTHLWKPLIHAVAAGSMNPSQHELDFMAQATHHNFRFRYGRLLGLDRANRRVILGATYDDEGRQITPERAIHYDTLIIAIGSVTNDFGTPGVTQYAVPLETLEQAVRFNQRLINACIRAHAQPGDVRPGQLHVAIIGAGATGTELAADVHRTARRVVAHGLDRVNPEKDIRVMLIEAAPRVVPALPERISARALELLTELGVEVRTNARVSEIRADGVQLADGEFIPSELVVWAAGVRAPLVLTRMDGLETNRINQLAVLPTLQTTLDPNVFAIGDCAACPRPGFPNPVPPRAQAAHQQASHMVRQMQRRLEGKPLVPYTYRDFGSLVTLGEYETVGTLGGLTGRLSGKSIFIEGLIARLMYRGLYKKHEMALHGTVKAFVGSLGRRFSRFAGSQVKLH